MIVHWAMTLQYHGGSLVLDAIRGRSTQGSFYLILKLSKFKKRITGLGDSGTLEVTPEDWGLFIPAISTMKQYLTPVALYEDIMDEKIILK